MTIPIAVNLVDYRSEWPELAAHHLDRLKILGATLAEFHHVGSTSVPGMVAKPVIDLMPLVVDLAELDGKRSVVEGLGYRWHGEYGVPGRRFCTLEDGDGQRIVQLHFYETGSPNARRHLAFRDYLRSFPEAAADYVVEKRRAAALFPDNSTAYANEKGAWIRATEAKALDWSVGEAGGV